MAWPLIDCVKCLMRVLDKIELGSQLEDTLNVHTTFFLLAITLQRQHCAIAAEQFQRRNKNSNESERILILVKW